MNIQQLIDEFLKQKRFALVGVSRFSDDLSRTIFKEFTRRGYDVVPVNPHALEIEGKRCVAQVQDITPPVTAALLMTSKEMADRVLLDCFKAGITLVWVFGIAGPQDISPHAQTICEKHGIALIPGYCPYMFIPDAGFFHRAHGWASKLTGAYPK